MPTTEAHIHHCSSRSNRPNSSGKSGTEPRINGSERLRPDMDITFPVSAAGCGHHPSGFALAQIPYSTRSSCHRRKCKDLKIPFVLESYGAFGSAKEVLKLLKAAANSQSALLCGPTLDSFAAQAARTILVALQKGNALIARRGATAARPAVERR